MMRYLDPLGIGLSVLKLALRAGFPETPMERSQKLSKLLQAIADPEERQLLLVNVAPNVLSKSLRRQKKAVCSTIR